MLSNKLSVLPGVLSVALSSALSSGCSTAMDAPGSPDSSPSPTGTVERLIPEIITVHPFDDTVFTQGLEVDGDQLLVGTGQYGGSEIFRTTLDGQRVDAQPLEDRFFGEGITRTDDHVWQLTWKAGTAFKRDAGTLEEIDRVSYEGEGWGLCSFQDTLIMSDGTNEIRHLDPDTFEETSRVAVTLDGQPVTGINELECVEGEVYANIFLATDILRFDPDTGEVTAVIDGSALPNNALPDPNNVLNGIAHIPGSDRFYLTGKRWPDLYEVRFVGADQR